MPRRSKIKELPANVKAQIDKWLSNDQATIDDIVAYCEDAGHDVSRSSVGRYRQKFEEVAKQLRHSREMAEALVQEIGPAATEGKVGRLLVEILQKLTFDLLLDRAGKANDPLKDDEPAQPKELQMLARALKDMASAQKIDVDREASILRDFAFRAADEVEKTARAEGLSAKTISQFRASILGLP